MSDSERTSAAVEQGGGADAGRVEAFIARWAASSGAERANYQIFLAELCDLLGLPRPEPSVADEAAIGYVFEKAVTFHNPDGKTSGGRLGVGNDPRYNKTACFDPFPFPAATEAQQQTIRELGEALDAQRKKQ